MKKLTFALVLLTATWNPLWAQAPASSAPSTDEEKPPSEFLWLDVRDGRIAGRAYVNTGINSDLDTESTTKPVLAVVLHGDLLPPDFSYHYRFADQLAAQTSNTVVVGLIRPGYVDESGNRSDGDAQNRTGDNYTAEVAEAIASATMQLKERYGADSSVLIGHSGGAAVAALVLGLHPDVADAALLVACPCDVPKWREHMMTLRPHPIWREPHDGLSPLAHISGVRPSSIVELMVGAEDEVVQAEYSTDYAAALRQRSVSVDVTVLPGLGHNILVRPPVIDRATELLKKIAPRH